VGVRSPANFPTRAYRGRTPMMLPVVSGEDEVADEVRRGTVILRVWFRTSIVSCRGGGAAGAGAGRGELRVALASSNCCGRNSKEGSGRCAGTGKEG
jgi:hypothetical protein